MKHFKRLLMWQKGIEIGIASHHFSLTLPQEQKFILGSQIQRAAFSIPANIAEGSSRFSEKDYCRFIEIALGSAFELETHLLLTEALSVGNSAARGEILLLLDEEQKMIFAFLNKLRGR